MPRRSNLAAGMAVFVVLAAFILMGAARPWATSEWNFKTRQWGSGCTVTAPSGTSVITTVSLSGIDAMLDSRESKCIAIENTSSTTAIYVNLESARSGQLQTATYNPGVRIGPGQTRSYDFTTSAFETRVATGDGDVDIAYEVTW